MAPLFTPFHHGGSGPPLVLIHGVTDTWSTWNLVIPDLEKQFEVLAVTMPGHAGGPAINGEFTADTLPAGIEAAMDEVGFVSAHVAGNSLGGWVALRVAERGRALSVTGLAPVGGWSDDFQERHAFDYFVTQQKLVKRAAPFAEQIASTPEGRRQATRFIVENDSLITPEIVVRQIVGAANCPAAMPLVKFARNPGFLVDSGRIDCPVRFIWGTSDQLLRWPDTAVRFQAEWFPE